MRIYDEYRRAWTYAVWVGMTVACICAMHVNALAAQSATDVWVKQQIAIYEKYIAWMNAPWADDPNGEYVYLRRHIDQQIASGQKPIDVFKVYKARHDHNPSDPVARFGYDYSAIVFFAGGPSSFGDQREVIMCIAS